MISLAIGGSKGRMGRRLCDLVADDPRFEIVAEFDRDHVEGRGAFGVLIDFSVPEGTMHMLELCREAGAALVTGTTGFSEDQRRRLERAAAQFPVLWAANFSLGINFLLQVLPGIAGRLHRNFDIELVETHHNRKIDAPSGTALSLLEVLLAATGRSREDHVVFGREGQVGAKDRSQIGVHAVRSGDVVGRHQIIFGGTGESITITHEAHSRDTFVKGALEAAAWIHGKPPGMYSMQDVTAFEG